MAKGYKIRFKATSPKKGYRYKTVGGYANALYKKYKGKIDQAQGMNFLASDSDRKKVLKNLIKSQMKEDPSLTMRQAASKVLNTETFTTAKERTEIRMKKDFSEFRSQLGYEKGHRFRDNKGHYRSLKDMLGSYDNREGTKGYHFTDYRPDESGKLSAYEYVVKYNYSPKGEQARWTINLVSIKRV